MDKFVKIFTRVTAVIVILGTLAVAGIITYTIGWLNGYDAHKDFERYQEQVYEEYLLEHPDTGFKYYEWVEGREVAE